MCSPSLDKPAFPARFLLRGLFPLRIPGRCFLAKPYYTAYREACVCIYRKILFLDSMNDHDPPQAFFLRMDVCKSSNFHLVLPAFHCIVQGIDGISPAIATHA